ncbi:MAG: RNA methyltransferase [Burkholderiales bacterium]|nr:RNA methyltransferase [Burkholderiales bacterium]
MRRIQSRDNPRFKQLSRLATSARERSNRGHLLLDGVHLIDAYVAAFGAKGVSLIVCEEASDHPEIGRIRALVDEEDGLLLPRRLFDGLSPVEAPVGVMALAPMPSSSAAPGAGEGFSLFLDGVQEPGNLGAILRSAAAAGGSEAFLSPSCADPWSPRCLRGGMGAQFQLTLHPRQDLVTVAQSFSGCLIAAVASGDTELFALHPARRCAFIIGGEGQGVSEALLACAALRVRIPMAAGIESLNVASAATLLFYEWARAHGRG